MATPFIANAWYGAIWADDLCKQPVARRILDRPIVLYRTDDGAVAALEDMCPHRFAPLHMGQVIGDRLRCPYHGLEFDPRGQCRHNPHTTGRIPPAARVKHYHANERHGMIWVWLGAAEPDLAAIPDYSMLDTSPRTMQSKRDWLIIKANYRLIVENLLDLSHVAVLHKDILGNAETMDADISVREEGGDLVVTRLMPGVTPPKLMDILFHDDARRVDHWSTIRLTGVSCLINDAGVTDVDAAREQGAGMYGAHILTPIDDATTLYHFCAVRWSGEGVCAPGEDVLEQLSALRRTAFAEQDRPIIEAQQRAQLDHALDTSRPAMFDIDAGPARLQRRLDAFLKKEVAASAATPQHEGVEELR